MNIIEFLDKKKQHSGKIILSFIILLYFLLYFFFSCYLKINIMEASGVPVAKPSFWDLRVITSGADALRAGYDPMPSNPFDSEKRPWNHPRIWHVFVLLFGITEKHTVLLGFLLAFCFFISIIKIIPKTNNFVEILIYSLIILSPATLLAVERGNNDIIIFILLSIASIYFIKNNSLFYSMIFFSSLLKLFPIFAFITALKENQNNFKKILITFLSLFLFYIIFSWKDIIIISRVTPRFMWYSYGNMPLASYLTQAFNFSSLINTKLLCWGLTLLTFLSTFKIDRATKWKIEQTSEYITLFRIGAGIYVGTFLLGNNFIYRLIFLIFTIPQLLAWANTNNTHLKRLSWLSILIILAVFWSSFWIKYLHPNPSWNGGCLWEELLTWSLFSIFLFILLSSKPSWLKINCCPHIPLCQKMKDNKNENLY